MSRGILHYRADDNHPNIIEGSLFRPSLCNSNAVFLHEKYTKGTLPKSSNAMTQGTLGFDYRGCDQSYYTDDKDRVTCKNCLKKLATIPKYNDVTNNRIALTNLIAKRERLEERIEELQSELHYETVTVQVESRSRKIIDAIAVRLAAIRKDLGLTQLGLSKKAGISRDIVSRIENSILRDIGICQLRTVLDALGVDLVSFLSSVEDLEK